jgi:2-polyprenyl-3-methyl-5-hydroxy-6-metoxy-1,4-benzoquinol methylase
MMIHSMTENAATTRAAHEIEHGRKLAAGDPDLIWGWATPAGKLRAARRGELIARGAQLGPGVRALEVGCGSGLFTEMFARSGATIVAVDISAELLDRARSRNLPADRVTFMEKRFEDCAVNGPFDAVIGSSILHHLEQRQSIAQMFDLLRPGGRFSFAEPNMLNPQIAVQKNVPWIKERLGDSPDETAFVRWKLAKMLQDIGFSEIQLTPFDWLHPATPRPLIPVVRGVGKVLEILPGLREFSGSLHILATRPA